MVHKGKTKKAKYHLVHKAKLRPKPNVPLTWSFVQTKIFPIKKIPFKLKIFPIKKEIFVINKIYYLAMLIKKVRIQER